MPVCRECGAELIPDEKITGVTPAVGFGNAPLPSTQYRCMNKKDCHLAQIEYPQFAK